MVTELKMGKTNLSRSMPEDQSRLSSDPQIKYSLFPVSSSPSSIPLASFCTRKSNHHREHRKKAGVRHFGLGKVISSQNEAESLRLVYVSKLKDAWRKLSIQAVAAVSILD